MGKVSFKCLPEEVGLQQLVYSDDNIDVIVRSRSKTETSIYNINILEQKIVDVHLAPKESSVLSLVAAGFTNQEIAVKMDIQLVTVKKYVSALLYKLEVTNRVMLSNYYYNYLASYTEV